MGAALFFLGRLVPAQERGPFLDDLREMAEEERRERGDWAALWWLWLQIATFFIPWMRDRWIWRTAMWANQVRMAFRQLRKQRGVTLLNILGLALGLVCFGLITLYVRYEKGYESQHLLANRIYRVNLAQHMPDQMFRTSYSPVPLGPALKETVHEIEGMMRLSIGRTFMICRGAHRFYESDIALADADAFRMLTFVRSKGGDDPLANPHSVVITQEIAAKYFGDEDPIGKTLSIDDRLDMTVTAVVRNPQTNTRFNASMYLAFPSAETLFGQRYLQNRVSTVLQTYVLLAQGADPVAVTEKLNDYFVNVYGYSPDIKVALELDALPRIRLHSLVGFESNPRTLAIFSITGILVLLIACINFVNLATARSANRAKEVGIRKVAGAFRRQLIIRFMVESLVMAGLALVLAMAGMLLSMPAFRNLTGQVQGLADCLSLASLGTLLAATLVAGLLAGSYPALYLSAFRPAAVLKGALAAGGKSAGFRRMLVILQFAIATGLIIATLVVGRQLTFMKSMDLGFTREQMLVVQVRGDALLRDLTPLKSEVLRLPGVLAASGSQSLPGFIGRYNNVTWEGAPEGERVVINQTTVDEDFVPTYEMKMVMGRNFEAGRSADSLSMLINETAMRRFGWTDVEGKVLIHLFGNRRYPVPVLGVVKDFHYGSLRTEIAPMSFYFDGRRMSYLSLHLDGRRIPETLKAIEAVWKRVNPQQPLDYSFLDERFENRYRSEAQMKDLFSYFSALTILISCLGLYGLAAFAAEQRTREIGIRKVLGATAGGMVALLSKQFLKWVVMANAISWPLAWWLMSRWLSAFPYRTNLGWTAFALAGLGSVVIALATVSYHALKAAYTHPAHCLRSE